MIYFTSDFHFSHSRILSFERWNFTSIQEHDEYVMKMLEEKLGKDDILYFLGDLGWPSEDIVRRIRALECQKYMIVGNHDKKSDIYYKEELGFTEVYNHPLWLSNRIVISHYPVPVEDGVVNIHGHLHGAYLEMKNYINANVHMQDYKLVTMKKVNNLIGRLPKPNRKFLEEWFAEYQVYTPEQMEKKKDEFQFRDDGVILYKK